MTVQVSACPPRSELVKLTSGRLPPPDVETLLQHLETCPGCFAQVPELSSAPDTLVELLAKAKTPPPGWRDPIIGSLIARLVKLRKFVEPGPKMLIFPCPACGKNMKAGVEFVGKNLKCPTCARVVVMPPPPAPNLSEKTLPPAVAGTLRVPSGTAHGVCLLQPESGSIIQGVPISENTQVPAVAESFPFLAPAQQLDELGRLSHYRVLKKLGAGGMGVVFLAEDTQLHRKVALKTMLPAFAASPENRERFLREARAAASIEHDHIVAIHQVGEANGVPYLAMPLLKGEPLDARLEREGKLPVAEAVRIAAEMAEGLAAAHAASLIHRDIKPGNVWLEASPGRKSGEGRVKILDFGLARSQHENVRLTQAGAVLGTPAYMPPEQAQGETVDERGDLFSLGCVLYEMLTGERPFRGDNTIALLAALALQEPTPPNVKNPEVPVGVSDLTMQLLAKKPAERPASASVVARQLRWLLQFANKQQGRSDKATPTKVPRFFGFAAKAAKQGAAVAAFASKWPKSLLAACAVALLMPLGYWAFQVVIVRDKEGNEIARFKVPKDGSYEVVSDKSNKEELKPNPITQVLRKKADGPTTIEIDFSYFHKTWGLEVESFSLKRGKLAGSGFDPTTKALRENWKYEMTSLMRFKKDLSAEELKNLKEAFNTYAGHEPKGIYPGVPPAPDKVIYWFYDKENIPVFKVGGRPKTIEGELTGKKDDAFRASVEFATEENVENFIIVIVRPKEDQKK